MARAHSIAPVVIDATDQQRFGFGTCGRVVCPLVIELGLDGVEEITIEDGWLLPGEDLPFKVAAAPVARSTHRNNRRHRIAIGSGSIPHGPDSGYRLPRQHAGLPA